MPERAVGVAHTVGIDSTGEVATFDLGDAPSQGHVVSLNIDGTTAADYAVDIGVRDGDGGTKWYTDEETYSASAISDAWKQSDRFLRLRVTSAAGAGDTADIAVSAGD